MRASPPLTEEIGGQASMRPKTAVPVPAPQRTREPTPDGLLAGCWYADPLHRPSVGWCPALCSGPATHSERTGRGDQHVYCEAHANWRRRTIRLPLVRRLAPGEQPLAPQ